MNRMPLSVLLVVLAKALTNLPLLDCRAVHCDASRRNLQSSETQSGKQDSTPEPPPEPPAWLPHPLLLIAMTGILSVPIALCVSKSYYTKKAIEGLPRAIPLSPDELGAHMSGEKPKAKLENLKDKKLAGEWTACTETEFVYTGGQKDGQKGSVFVFAAPDSTRYHLGKMQEIVLWQIFSWTFGTFLRNLGKCSQAMFF